VVVGHRLGVDWWTASGRASLLTEGKSDGGYSASLTRETCACNMLGQGGCATPEEGAPVQDGGYAPGTAGASQGPSTLTVVGVVGAVGAVGVLGLLIAGVI
jgi:hypothetical protein